MGKIVFIILFVILNSVNQCSCQPMNTEYSNLIDTADSLYNNGQYLSAAKIYNKAFNNKNGYSMNYHRLYAAIAWNKAGYQDSAFSHLFFLVFTMRFDDTLELRNNFYNTPIFYKPDFIRIYQKAACQKSLQSFIYDSSLAKFMEFVYTSDQSTRSLAGTKLAKDKNAFFSQFENEHILDSIYNKYGWLVPSQIGVKGSQVMFLIVQHSNLEYQLKWLERVKQGVSNCLLLPEYEALLTDRILISQGKKQIYGTQLFWNDKVKRYQFLPIQDITKADFLRNRFGMNDLKSYLLIQNNGN